MRIAIVGSGISGLACAWLLNRRHAVTVYEAEARAGGHSNTIEVAHQGGRIPVDTGFIVYNEPNYPNLTRLFEALDVPTHRSDMSFAVSIGDGRIEYCGSGPRALFARSRNVVSLDFHRMLLEIVRFNRAGTQALVGGIDDTLTLGGFLAREGFGEAFRRRYLLPMAAAIWSGSTGGMLDFPARTFLRFFANHGLLTVAGQPEWRTVTGGSRVYVGRIAAALGPALRTSARVVAARRVGGGVEVIDAGGGRERYDHVVLACHADQALAAIEAPTPAEASVLGAFAYRTNHAVVHRDAALMPRRRAAWASWNYLAEVENQDGGSTAVTYWMNRLQGLPEDCPVFVSLNPLREPEPSTVEARFDYAHPQFTRSTLQAQARLPEIQGRERIWFAGAHWGYGFHEDGLRSGLDVAAALGVRAPWWPEDRTEVGAAPSLPLPAAAKPE
ncbi:MAG TPA: FAD-dependent oxidoreductase [Geminicoccaceae bacterium]